jgi:hypothetical protein
LDRCDYPQFARCRLNGLHQFKKAKKTQPLLASNQEEDSDADEPVVGDFEVDPRCEGSDPLKPLHFKHVNDCTK